jgi:hypothetical protein
MAFRKGGELFALAREQHVGADCKSPHVQLDQARESLIEVALGATLQNVQFQTKGIGCRSKPCAGTTD